MPIIWNNIGGVQPISYTCGHCGSFINSPQGFSGQAQNHGPIYIRVCHVCGKPTFFDADGKTYPGSPHGPLVTDISDENVRELYQEARRCSAAGSHTGAVLCCRKLLMHIAVAKSAPAGKTFLDYVQFLIDNHFVPPGSEPWLDQIRQKGNEANHQINIMKPQDSEILLTYCGMLLKMIYEFPASLKKYTSAIPPA